MYKVVLIDDEPLIRKGIKNIINWKQLNCEVYAEASDGNEGLELIRQSRPEIILTDIRMPRINGLEMLKQIRDIVPNSKTIIITGYREFDYAQDAIKYGAFDFLLKPTKLEQLTSVLVRAIDVLNKQKLMHAEVNKFKLLFEQSVPMLKEKLLCDIVFELNNNEKEVTEKMKLFDIHINSFVFVVVENDSYEDFESTQYDKHLYQFGIINSYEEIFAEKYEIHVITLNSNKIGFILQNKSYLNINMSEILEKTAYLQEMISNAFGISVSISLSSEGSSVFELPEKLKECNYSLEYRSYLGNNTIIQFSDLSTLFKFEEYSSLERYKRQMLEGIKAGNENLVKNSLDKISGFISSTIISNNYLRNYYYSTLSSINNIRNSVLAANSDKKHEDSIEFSSILKMIEKSDNTEELNSLIENVAINISKKVNNFNNKSIKITLRKAINYINEHYSEQLTLYEVAAHTFVTTFYISRMFKKELGTTFVDYLNDLRIEKAKELLKNVRYKSYEVASLVGIPDPHYFSRLFKKHSGITPSEYRDNFRLK